MRSPALPLVAGADHHRLFRILRDYDVTAHYKQQHTVRLAVFPNTERRDQFSSGGPEWTVDGTVFEMWLGSSISPPTEAVMLLLHPEDNTQPSLANLVVAMVSLCLQRAVSQRHPGRGTYEMLEPRRFCQCYRQPVVSTGERGSSCLGV